MLPLPAFHLLVIISRGGGVPRVIAQTAGLGPHSVFGSADHRTSSFISCMCPAHITGPNGMESFQVIFLLGPPGSESLIDVLTE